MSRLRILAVALAAAGLSACTTLAPDYQRPAAPVAAAWPAAGAAADTVAADSAWRELYVDERLQALIERALEHNRDLRVAALNIEAARAQYGIQRADQLPSLALGATQNAQRVPGDLNSSGESMVSRQYAVTLGITSWELDFFGRVRSLRDAALEQYLASEQAHRSARISLVAEVAAAWLQLAAEGDTHALAAHTVETRESALRLIRASHDAGVAGALELRQSEGELARARADLAASAARLARARNALEVLAGGPLAAQWLPQRLHGDAARLAELPAGLPAEVLASRPDVSAAEHRLRAANANIGAARAAFFPRITLTASSGSASAGLSGLFEGGSRAWSFVPQLTLPIFEAGRLAASLDLAEVRRDIAVAEYEKAVQQAFREVADALAERDSAVATVAARSAVAEAAAASLELAEARYEAGVDGFLVLLDAQRTHYAAEQELIAARLAEASSRVTAYKVLGGGWQ